MAKRRIVLINRRWGVSFRERREVDERKDVEIQLGEKIATVLFSEGTFELVETCGPSPSAAVPVVKPAGAFITATPNPVPMDGSSFGISEIAWNTGDGNPGEVMLALRGHAEQPFYSSVPGDARGKKAADFLTAGTVYEFRLYAGKDRKRLLDKVRVTRSPQ